MEILHRHPLNPDAEWLGFMEALAGQAAIAIENASLLKELQHTHFELTLAYDTTIEGWARALDLRDRDTEDHTQRVAAAALKLARRLGMQKSALVQVRRGAMLHDIGKMAIPDSILLKNGPLTADEWKEVRRHPQYAYDLLSPIPYLADCLDIPRYHHERWDGTGYPSGIEGQGNSAGGAALRGDRRLRRVDSGATLSAGMGAEAGPRLHPPGSGKAVRSRDHSRVSADAGRGRAEQSGVPVAAEPDETPG